MTGVQTCALPIFSLGVRVVGFESNINPYLFIRRNMLDLTFSLNRELAVVAISTMHYPHSLDLFDGKGCNLLFGITHKPESSNATAIGEGDMLAIRLYLPARLFVLDRAVIMLKFGIAFLAWLVVLAVVIEAGNSEPRSIC